MSEGNFAGLWRATWLLTLARARMVSNTVVYWCRERRAAAAALCLLALFGVYCSFSFAGLIFGLTTPTTGQMQAIAAGILVMLAGFTTATSITFALSSLFFARDLEFLLKSPIPPGAVVMSRVLTQLGLGAGIGILLVLPPFFAFGISAGHFGAVIPAAIAVFVMATIFLNLATLFVLVVVRLIPARYIRDAGAIVVTLSVFAIAAVNLFVRGGDILNGQISGNLDPSRYGAGLASSPWQPVGWTARIVTELLTSNQGAAILWSIPLIGVAAITFFAVFLAGQQLYVSGYQRNAGAQPKRRRHRQASGQISNRTNNPAWQTLFQKDWREIRRDPSQMGQLIMPLLLFALYIGSPGHNPGEFADPVLPHWYGAALTAAFASLFSASGIALRGVGTEGMRFWIIRSAPVSARSLMLAKWAVGFVVACGLGAVLLLIGEWKAGLSVWDGALVMVTFALVICGLIGLASGLGALRPRLDWTDPRRAVSIGITILFLLIGSVYLLVCFVALALPYVLISSRPMAALAGNLAVLVLAATVSFVAMQAGAARLAVIEL